MTIQLRIERFVIYIGRSRRNTARQRGDSTIIGVTTRAGVRSVGIHSGGVVNGIGRRGVCDADVDLSSGI